MAVAGDGGRGDAGGGGTGDEGDGGNDNGGGVGEVCGVSGGCGIGDVEGR